MVPDGKGKMKCTACGKTVRNGWAARSHFTACRRKKLGDRALDVDDDGDGPFVALVPS